MQNTVVQLSLEDRLFEKKTYVENSKLIQELNLVLGEKRICGKAEIEIKLKNNSCIKTEFYKDEEWGIIAHDNFVSSIYLFSQIESLSVINSSIEKFISEENEND